MDKWLRTYQWALNLVAIALAMLLVASLVNRVIAGQLLAPLTVPKLPPYEVSTTGGGASTADSTPNAGRWAQSLASRCLFGCADEESEGDECPGGCEEGKTCEEGVCVPSDDKPRSQKSDVPVESDLGVKLMGCMVADNPEYSMAMVQGGESQETYVVGPGDYLPGDAKVVRIERDRIFIRRDGQLEYIQLEQTISGDPSPVSLGPPRGASRAAEAISSGSGGGGRGDLVRSSSGNDYVVDRNAIEEKLENPRELVEEVRVIPNFEKGERRGVKMVGVSPEGLYSKLGLQSGDVLRQVGDEPLNSQKDVRSLVERFKQRDSVSVVIERDGTKIEKNYRIE